MGQTAEELRQDIERTRQELTLDVDAISEKVSPGRVVHRRMEQTRGAVSSMRERVMGSASSAHTDAADAVSGAPDAVIRRTEGNPLAAGAVAFAAGWLVAGLIPTTKGEQQAAAAVEEKARDLQEPLKQQAAEIGQQMKEPLQERAQQSAEAVRDSATEAAETVRDQAQTSAQNLRQQTQ
jgi:type VI protein secretion system component VasK